MKEKLNTLIQSLSLVLVIDGMAWVVWSGNMTMKQMLPYLIVVVICIEILSLYMVGKIYPRSHTSFKIGTIASLFILLGIKTMAPGFFIPLTIALFAVNFLYNFYTNNKRRMGTFKRIPVRRIKMR